MPGAAEPVVIVVGGDALALSAAREVCLLQGHRVLVLWPDDPEFAAAVRAIGAEFVPGGPQSREGLIAAGVEHAVSFLALSRDDELNLQSALRARDANPHIRIVLRQFNRTLASKIEQNLPDCSVLSLAWHSAATYAAAALDPSCFRGLQFPDERGGILTGFARRHAGRAEIAGQSVGEAEETLGLRIVSVDGRTDIGLQEPLAAEAQLVVYGAVEALLQSCPRQVVPERLQLGARLARFAYRFRALRRGLDPYLATFFTATFSLFLVATWHFHGSLGTDWLTAAYFVVSTMTTTGLGDLVPDKHKPVDLLVAISMMGVGTVFGGVFIAVITAMLTRAQWVRMQGLRPIRRRGHIVVCGCGSIGTGVIDLLLAANKPIVVVEQNPDAALVERARELGFDLLTGDASRDDTLDLCNLAAAHSLVALTNVDSRNLEIALGARARNPSMPIVLRIAEAAFAASIARHFDFETTFSVAALAGPVFAGLSRVPGARGQISFDGQEFGIAEMAWSERDRDAPPEGLRVLAAVQPGGGVALVRDPKLLLPGARVLMLAPAAPFHQGHDTFAAAVERRMRHIASVSPSG